MKIEDFTAPEMGQLIPIRGSQGLLGDFDHFAFLPSPLPKNFNTLRPATYRACSLATAKMAAFNQSLSGLPAPSIFRDQVIRREAHATSAIEGTHTQLVKLFEADLLELERDHDLREVHNYVEMARYAFNEPLSRQKLSLNFLRELHQILFRGVDEDIRAGDIRNEYVYLGAQSQSIESARFIPVPPGDQLLAGLENLVNWLTGHANNDHNDYSVLDPIIMAAATHYQFETLHPFEDGNGRIGRFLLLSQLLNSGTLVEPIAISTWIETRRDKYTQLLYEVSTRGNWDGFITFIAGALEATSANALTKVETLAQILTSLKNAFARSDLRSKSAPALVDFAVQNPIFTVKEASAGIEIGYAGANKLILKSLELGLLKPFGESKYERKFYFPELLAELLKT